MLENKGQEAICGFIFINQMRTEAAAHMCVLQNTK